MASISTPYKRLQQRCKAAGLPANKSTAELSRMLAEHGDQDPLLWPTLSSVTSTTTTTPTRTTATTGAKDDVGDDLQVMPTSFAFSATDPTFLFVVVCALVPPLKARDPMVLGT